MNGLVIDRKMDIMIDELQTLCEINLAILKAMNKEE